MDWKAVKEFLKPTRSKILIALIIPFVFNVTVNVVSAFYFTLIKATPISYPVPFHEFLTYTFIPFIFSIIFCYPLACSIVTLYACWKSKTLNREILFWASCSIIFFNPIVFSFLSIKIISSILEPCGVVVIGIIPNSPAESIGIIPGSRIYYINEKPVYNITSFGEIMKATKPGDSLLVKIMAPNKTVYERKVILTTPPEEFKTTGGFLGVNVTSFLFHYCKLSE